MTRDHISAAAARILLFLVSVINLFAWFSLNAAFMSLPGGALFLDLAPLSALLNLLPPVRILSGVITLLIASPLWAPPAHIVLLVVGLFCARARTPVQSNSKLTGYRRNGRYWVDLCYAILVCIQVLFSPWACLPPFWRLALWTQLGIPPIIHSSIIALLVAPPAILLALYIWLYRTGSFRFHHTRRKAAAILRGKDLPAKPFIALIHNDTDRYFSSFSQLPPQHRGLKLCALDWERDVQAYSRLTPEGETLLLRQVQLLLYLTPAASREDGVEKLKAIWAQARQRGQLRPQTRLVIVFLSDQSDSVPIPPELGYVSQLEVRVVQRLDELSLTDLTLQRYHAFASGVITSLWARPHVALHMLTTIDKKPSASAVRLSANILYDQSPSLLLQALAPQGEDAPDRWDPLLSEFLRGTIQLTPCLSSLMALMDLVDMTLRLALYTLLMSREEHPPRDKTTVPDDYRELGMALFNAAAEGDAIYHGVREQTIPCRLPMLLWGVGELLQVQLEGDSFTCQGLCNVLYYLRNKTKGHGSIQGDAAGLLWTFVLEAALALGRMLCLERFTLRMEKDRVQAGWDGRLVDLGSFAVSAGDHPILAFDAKNERRPILIDYFRGALLVPTLGRDLEVIGRTSRDAKPSKDEYIGI